MKKNKACIYFLFLIITSCNISFQENNKRSYYDEIVYEIWVKSFADSDDSNEIGDIRGIIQKLDYLNDGDPKTNSDLGITAIKLSPIFECGYKSDDPAANMHGYDIVDYYTVNDLFGTKDDLLELINESHKRGINVVFDFVPNHTSHEHAWFLNSTGKGSKRDWYIWEETPDLAWQIPWGGGDWKDVWKKHEDSYYYSAYQFESLPDLNYKNEEVRMEMLNIVKYWLDFGFDGVRVDAPRYLVEDGPHMVADRPGTHAFFKDLRKLANQYNPPKMTVAEAWTSEEKIKDYYGNGADEFHMCFDFPFAYKVAASIHNEDVTSLLELIKYQQNEFPEECRTATLLANHDNINPRPYSLFDNDPQRAVLAAAFNILSTGVPFIYYGDEIGLEGKKGQGQDQDIRLRQAFNWQAVEEQSKDPNSIFSWYRNLITARKNYIALRSGEVEILDAEDKSILAMFRSYKKQNLLLVFNASGNQKDVKLDLSFLDDDNLIISPIIGDLYNDLTLNISKKITLKDIPEYSFMLLYIGNESQEKIAGFPKHISGGAKPAQLTKNNYSTMFLRGISINGNDVIQMKRNHEEIWSIVLDLEPGRYNYKFETGGKDIWLINWGDTEKDGIGDIDGVVISFEINNSGRFEFQFNERNYKYNVISR